MQPTGLGRPLRCFPCFSQPTKQAQIRARGATAAATIRIRIDMIYAIYALRRRCQGRLISLA